MKKFISVLLCILICFSLFSCGESVDDTERRQTADKFMDYFASGNYGPMLNMPMTKAVSSQVSVESLSSIWEDVLLTQFGAYDSYSGYLSETESGGTIVYMYGIDFEAYTIVMAVGVNKKGEIASFTVSQALSRAEAKFSEGITETLVTFGNEPYIISGSVIRKEGVTDSPAVIILSGSGPNERYGKIGANAVYANLADSLAKEGITVLIFDKRTYTYGQTMPEDELMHCTIEDEYLEDAKSAYEFIKDYDGVDKDRIYFAGHSLGGYILPMLDEYLSEKPQGYVFLCAPSDSMEDLVMTQLYYLAKLDGEVTDEEKQEISLYEKQVNNIRSLTGENKSQYSYADLLNSPPDYWLSLSNYDPAEKSKSITSKMFFAFGGKDYQVPEGQQDLYEIALEGRSDVTIKLYDNLCHALIDSEALLPSPDDYNVKSDINGELVKDIVNFILN